MIGEFPIWALIFPASLAAAYYLFRWFDKNPKSHYTTIKRVVLIVTALEVASAAAPWVRTESRQIYGIELASNSIQVALILVLYLASFIVLLLSKSRRNNIIAYTLSILALASIMWWTFSDQVKSIPGFIDLTWFPLIFIMFLGVIQPVLFALILDARPGKGIYHTGIGEFIKSIKGKSSS